MPSPGLTLDLPSNNPFRNRAASPALPSPASAHRSSSASRPMSRNPFLSTFEAEFNKEASRDLIDTSAPTTDSPSKPAATDSSHRVTLSDSPKKPAFETTTGELFSGLNIKDGDRRRAPARPPINRIGTDPRVNHRPGRFDDEDREKMPSQSRGPPRPRGAFSQRPPHPSSPERRENRPPRRNSESSMIDKGSLDPNEERRRRERRKEREERAKEKDGKPGQKRVRKPHGLDLIDRLDVTGIYGPSMIHHDGPYDAVQPHRNRKKDQRAPMHAFPVGSANNSLGGSGPVNQKIDLDRIHGTGAEGFTDFGSTETEWKKPRPQTEFSVKGRADIIHGEQTHGLGTSTFLEGAPASRKAQQETEAQRLVAESGIGRKKSIVQRFRGISQPRRFGDAPA